MRVTYTYEGLKSVWSTVKGFVSFKLFDFCFNAFDIFIALQICVCVFSFINLPCMCLYGVPTHYWNFQTIFYILIRILVSKFDF